MKVDVSIIIPCYNSLSTAEETFQSVIEQNYSNWEAIIVNDGSTDNVEEIALKWVEKDNRFKYYKKANGGLGSARNFGIEHSKGEYILPLDSDNKIRAGFVEEGLSIMNKNPEVGVIYGDAMYFGERDGLWRVGEFDRFKLLSYNYIDACALIRKSCFDELGIYDTQMPYQGHEDWEFWLRVLDSSYQFYYLDKVTFDYRVTSNSMIRSFEDEIIAANLAYIRNKHAAQICKSYSDLYHQYLNFKIISETSIMRRILQRIKRLFS